VRAGGSTAGLLAALPDVVLGTAGDIVSMLGLPLSLLIAVALRLKRLARR
jgi:hypothetical protein